MKDVLCFSRPLFFIWIIVKKKYSRRGAGGRLLQSMEDYVISREGRRIYIDTSSVPAFGATRYFYEKHGFRPLCVLEDFHRENDHKIIYVKELTR